MSTIRMVIAEAASKNYKMRGFDVKTAFLYGELEEEVFMYQPQGYVIDEDKVCLLKKSLYGLKQAPRQWNLKFSNFLLENGLRASESESCLFLKDKPLMIVCIYVDDGIIVSESEDEIDKLLTQLKSQFEIHEVDLTGFLGFQIERNEKGIFLHQSNYVRRLLEKFNMNECNVADSPVSSESVTNEESLSADIPYREAVGSLMYAAVITRMDIMFAVSKASRYQLSPSKGNWSEVKRIFRYLKGTLEYGLLYKKGESKIIGYSDADFAGDSNTSKSTTGTIVLYAGSSILWRSQLQRIVTLSSTEAELVSLCTLTQDIAWLRKLAVETHMIKKENSIELKCDNQSTIKLIRNEKGSQRTRHMSVKAAFTKERLECNDISIDHVKSEDQLADMLTKTTTVKSFVSNRDRVMAPRHIFLGLITLLSVLTIHCDNLDVDGLGPIVFRNTDKVAVKRALEINYRIDFVNPCTDFELNRTYPAEWVMDDVRDGEPREMLKKLIGNCNSLYKERIQNKLREFPKGKLSDPVVGGLSKKYFNKTYKLYTETNLIWGRTCNETQKEEGECLPVFSAYLIMDNVRNHKGFRSDFKNVINFIMEFTDDWNTKFQWNPWFHVVFMNFTLEKKKLLDTILMMVQNDRRLSFKLLEMLTGADFKQFYGNQRVEKSHSNIEVYSHYQINDLILQRPLTPDSTSISEDEIEVEEVLETDKGIIFKLLVVIPRNETFIFEVDAFSPLVENYGVEQRMKYVGLKYVMADSRGCVNEISEDVSELRFVMVGPCIMKEKAKLKEYWESTAEKSSYEIQRKEIGDALYIYCYPKTIFIGGIMYECEKDRPVWVEN